MGTLESLALKWNPLCRTTVAAPVEVPGKVLPAGTYPDYRLKPADKPVIQFEERASRSPQALKGSFYPGDEYGQPFVYPHKRAVELAKRTNQNVLSMRDEMSQNIATKATSSGVVIAAKQEN
jgi:hypothetical protein